MTTAYGSRNPPYKPVAVAERVELAWSPQPQEVGGKSHDKTQAAIRQAQLKTAVQQIQPEIKGFGYIKYTIIYTYAAISRPIIEKLSFIYYIFKSSFTQYIQN